MIAATVLGLCLGLSAPDTSPIVVPLVGTPATSIVGGNVADVGDAPATDDEADDNDGRGGGRGGGPR